MPLDSFQFSFVIITAIINDFSFSRNKHPLFKEGTEKVLLRLNC